MSPREFVSRSMTKALACLIDLSELMHRPRFATGYFRYVNASIQAPALLTLGFVLLAFDLPVS